MFRVVPTVRARAARRSGVLVGLVLLVVGLGVSSAAAHNALRATDPADGSTVPTAPPQVTLTFDQPALELGTQVVVTGPDGAVVSDGGVQLVDASVVQPLVAALPAGTYTVDWRVTSADGHPLSGSLTFTATGAAGVPEPAGPTDPADGTEPAEPTDAAEETSSASPSDEPTTEPEPSTDEAVVPVDAPREEDAPSPWVWVALGTGALAALVGGATAAVVASRRRGAQVGTGGGVPGAGTSADDPATDPRGEPTTGLAGGSSAEPKDRPSTGSQDGPPSDA